MDLNFEREVIGYGIRAQQINGSYQNPDTVKTLNMGLVRAGFSLGLGCRSSSAKFRVYLTPVMVATMVVLISVFVVSVLAIDYHGLRNSITFNMLVWFSTESYKQLELGN
ncbi:hypothetical protein L484_015709 [Morus notabilis]|uniref:Uncharacterized protein n=1 Tax=Morus notabilis TaxID=981085 RepID=W9SB02_9ROSA|nr:hypothetical protein L484_015709 [Morus notabilis]